MSGSRRWGQYESDDGLNFAVELDEDTRESASLDFGVVDLSETVEQGRVLMVTGSRPLKMRYVNANRVANGTTIRRSFPVGTLAAFSSIKGSQVINVGGIPWNVSSLIGERSILIPSQDTAQLDGDSDPNTVP